MKTYNVAVVGATGLVGREMIKILEERDFPVKNLSLLASDKSAGTKILFKSEEIEVENFHEDFFNQIDIALFSAGGEVSKKLVPIAVSRGAIVIDNSSFFRMHNDVPLVIPEVNPEMIFKHDGIIANPNCSTIQMIAALAPIHRISKIKKVVVSTYQAVSGSGKSAIDELYNQTREFLADKKMSRSVYPHQIAFNAIPHIDTFESNGFTKEEMKMVHETRKILNDENIKISPTCVRIPAFFGHAESIYFELENKIELSKIKDLIQNEENLKLIDDISNDKYPLQIMTEYYDEVMVGRIRKDLHNENGYNIWVVANNLRKGAALNAVQIAEKLILREL
jgi:aspartate-semialdehyde dehydrogenase